jgi:hypothetical protein
VGLNFITNAPDVTTPASKTGKISCARAEVFITWRILQKTARNATAKCSSQKRRSEGQVYVRG